MKPRRIAQLLLTHTPALFRAAVERAAELLHAGEAVALPTETVYGLAANALNAPAVERIFQIKGRPSHNPIIVHVAGAEMAQRCVAHWTPLADKLARSFWPGPLTLVLPRAKDIPDVVTAGGPTVGVRWPSHPFIQAVIRACSFPLAAPSANTSNRVSPTTAEHVRKDLGRKIPLIVDGGPCQIGIESTVVDVSVSPPSLLRPGMIHEQALLAVTGSLARTADHGPEVLKSPGLLRQHYAPRARLMLASWQDQSDLQRLIAEFQVPRSAVHVLVHTHNSVGGGFGRVSVIPRDAQAFARAIYAELHACDEAGAQLIVVEALPDAPEWKPIADRLNKASAPP
jgi:L-threonylcarbamoyladenylate synthase